MPDSSITLPTLVRPPPPDPLAGTGPFVWAVRVCVYGFLGIAFCLGGPVERGGAIAAALLVPWADHAGALRWFLRMIGLVISLALAPWVSIPLGLWAAYTLRVQPAVTLAAAVLVLGTVLGVLGSYLGCRTTAALRRHRYLYVLNRSGGTLLGVAEGALLMALFGWLLMLFGPTLALYAAVAADKRPRLAPALEQLVLLRDQVAVDDTGRWLQKNNPLPRIPAVATVAAASDLWAEPWLFWGNAEEECVCELLAIPAVQRHFEVLRNDRELKRAVIAHDLVTVLRSPNYLAMLEDREFCAVMAAYWPRVRARVSDEELQRARLAATRNFDAAAEAQLERAVKKAEEYDIKLP